MSIGSVVFFGITLVVSVHFIWRSIYAAVGLTKIVIQRIKDARQENEEAATGEDIINKY